MVLAQKQTHRLMEQNKPTHIWSINLQQKSKEYIMQKGLSPQ